MLGEIREEKDTVQKAKEHPYRQSDPRRGLCKTSTGFVSMVFDDLASLLEISWAEEKSLRRCSN